MDPNTQQPIPVQPTVTPVTNQPIPEKKSFNKKILLGIGIIVVLILAVIYFLVFNRYSFTINGKSVAKSDFQNAYTFYKKQNDPKTFDRNAALKATEQFFVENYVLKAEYFSKGHDQNDLDKAVQNTTTGNPQIPEVLNRISRENTVIKQSMQSSFGIKSVTGEVFKLEVPAGINAATQKTLSGIMTQRLSFYRNQLNQGVSYAAIKHNFLTDVTFINYPQIIQTTLQFTDMTSEHPIIPQEKFVNALFATKANSFSQVINLSQNNSLWYGIAYVQKSTGGSFASYNDWLAAKRKSVTIKSNFGGIK
jgi:hypothetical protein